jgi:hypothetical protein
MSFDVHGRARVQPGSATTAPRAAPADAPARSGRVYAWLAAVAISATLALMIVASLSRASWMGPQLPMPKTGPPIEFGSWHIALDGMAAALWLSAVVAGLGVAAGLVAVRRGARPPVRLLIAAAAVAIAILTVLPPVGSTDSLDYMAFGRIVALGHSPYVMVPRDLRLAHDAVAASIPWEWAKVATPYGPAATVEQFVAARLGGASAARIVFWLKLANAVAFGAVAYTADRLLRSDPAARLRAHLLWTVNPLLIWQLIAAAHLDVLAAAAGMLGLVVAGGWSVRPAIGHSQLGRVLAGGALIGVAADIKINFILFGLGLAWALRRSAVACLASACAMLAVLLPSYAWFGPPAIRSLAGRGNRVTADNFYQLFTSSQHGFLMHHVAAIGTVLVVGAAIVTLTQLPGRKAAPPAIYAALALSTAWLFAWQYQLPSYEAMVICLLILVPACWLDWLVIARLTAATIALMPGNPTPPQSPVLARIGADALTLVAPIVLVTALAALIVLSLAERRRSRPSSPAGGPSSLAGGGGALAPQSQRASR